MLSYVYQTFGHVFKNDIFILLDFFEDLQGKIRKDSFPVELFFFTVKTMAYIKEKGRGVPKWDGKRVKTFSYN